MTIRSNPPGAMVYIDDYQIGTTPVSTGYTYYGTRKIRLVKDGYETLTVYQPMPTPWYEFCGIDFFSENIWPGKIRDERSFNYQMTPLVAVPTDQLVSRAEQLRAASRTASAADAPPVVVSPQIALPVPTETLPPPVSSTPAIGGTQLGQPSFVAPPVYTSPPAGTAPPATGTPSFPAPMPGAIPNYGPPGGAPTSSAPYIPPATTSPGTPGSYPSYPPAGGTPTNTPGAYPGYSAPPSGPVLPPDWRPVGQVPNAAVQR